MPHTVTGKIAQGGKTIMAECLCCKVAYYRSDVTFGQLRCVECGGEMQIVASDTDLGGG